MRRGLLVLLLAGAVAAVWTAAGSGSGDKTSAATDKAAAGTSVTISNEQGQTWTCGYNPFNASLVDWSFGPIYESLVFVDVLKSGAATPWLASKYAWSNHNKTVTFTMRPGVKWSDGQPLTSDDVLFTYNLIFAPEYAAVASPRRGDFTQHVANISAPDPYTFVVKTQTPYAPFLVTHGQYGIMPKHVLGSLAPAAINTADFNSAPMVTNGAFKFVRWDKGAQVVFTRNPNYYRGAPLLDQFVYKVVPNTTAVANQLKTGEIDAGQLDPSQVDSMRTEQSIGITGFAVPGFQFYMQNLDPSKPTGQIFQDLAVRQALYTAINRDGIVKTVLFGQGQVANSVEPPTSWAWNPNAKPVYKYDPSKANQMLDQAG